MLQKKTDGSVTSNATNILKAQIYQFHKSQNQQQQRMMSSLNNVYLF